MDSLRLILVVLGVALVAGVYLYHRRPPAERERCDSPPPPGRERAPQVEGSGAEAEELIVVLSVMAREGYHFAGPGLLEVLGDEGLLLGKRRVFQLEEPTADGSATLFSVANILEPGVFPDEAGFAEFTTPGLALLLRLPAPTDGREAFKRMLTTAKALAERLGGELCDEARHPLSRQKAAYLYERIRDYEWRRKARPGGRARGGR